MKCSEVEPEWLELRQQAQYWRAQHSRAVERERAWKSRALDAEKLCRELQRQLHDRDGQIEALKAKVAQLQQQVFGQSSERTKDSDTGNSEGAAQSEDESGSEGEGQGSEESNGKKSPRRKRGKQRGTKGYGRRRRHELSTKTTVHELPEESQQCPRCGKPRNRNGFEESEEIEWEVRVYRRVHKRRRYVKSCDCPGVPCTVTAPAPPKLISKGMFALSFHVNLLMEKYLYQRPLNRILKMLSLQGLSLSPGTVTGNLKRIGELVQPLYHELVARSRSANHWHMDETRWMVFVERDDKKGYRWWLWVIITAETVVYLVDPSRSSRVPREFLGEDAEGIISADRYSAYKALQDLIEVAFCWTHQRRDFIKIRDGYKKLRAWATGWIDRIGGLFHLNKRRLAVRQQREEFSKRDAELRAALAEMEKARDQELADPQLHPQRRKALQSLKEHWNGLTLFVDRPDIPMDNSEAERRLREQALGRKNYYGSGSVWSATLAAMLFSLFQTLLLNGLDPQKFLFAYFEACAKNGGKAPDEIQHFLPWNLTAEQKMEWRLPGHPP